MGERQECPPSSVHAGLGQRFPMNKKRAMGALPPETFDVNLQNFNIVPHYGLL